MQPSSINHPYKHVSGIVDSSGNITTMLIGSIAKGLLVFAAVACCSYSLISQLSANSSPPPLPKLPRPSNFVGLLPTEVVSPYEKRWQDVHLPRFATKKINFDVPEENQICFAHVGKTAGSTLGCSLGFSLHCNDGKANTVGRVAGANDKDTSIHVKDHRSPNLLAKLTAHTFHSDVYDCNDNSGYFLFVLRDPIDRVMSAFNYDKPDNDDFITIPNWANRKSHFYFECPFYHMENFVQNGLRKEGGGTDRCKAWARESLQGREGGSRDGPDHWYYNYQYYLEGIPSDAKLLTVRNEHIEEDVRSIEDLFDCPEEERLTLSNRMNTNTWADQDDMYLSADSTYLLCDALCNEIQIYKEILDRSLNLSQDQLQDSLTELVAKCPREAMTEECSDVIPDISIKLQAKRGY